MPLTLSPLAIVEDPGLRGTAQTGEGRLVEDVLQCLVASPHSTVIADPFAGVVGGRYEAGVGGKLVGALEGREISRPHQELGSEGYSHSGQASEDSRLLSGEKTLLELLIESLEALLEGEHLSGELGDDAGAYVLCGQDDALSLGRTEGLSGEGIGAFDAAVSEIGGDPLAASTADLSRHLVMRDEGESATVVKVQSPLQSGK